MTFTSLTLYTHGLIPVTWQSHYRLFLASLFIRLDVTLDVCLKACVERVNRVFMSLLVFSLQIKARRGQKVKKKKKEATRLLHWSEIRFNSSTSERLKASSTPFPFLSPLSLSTLSLSSPLASAVLLYLRHSGIKLRDSKVFPGLSTEKEKWLAFLKTKKVRVATAPRVVSPVEGNTVIVTVN